MRFRVLSTARPTVQPGARPATSAPRPVYVLVHGIGASHRYFARLHDRLAQGADVHSVTLPGFAELPKPDFSPTVAEMSAALGDVLDRIGVTRAVLVGHSMGAQWVVELAVQRPDLTVGVVLMGPVADDRHRSALAQGVALAVDVAGETIPANAVVFADYTRSGPLWYFRQLPHMIAYPIEERIRLLTAPALVLRGGNDPVAGLEWCRRLRDAAPDGLLVQVPGHRHVVQFTAPAAVAGAIAAFVAARVIAD